MSVDVYGVTANEDKGLMVGSHRTRLERDGSQADDLQHIFHTWVSGLPIMLVSKSDVIKSYTFASN